MKREQVKDRPWKTDPSSITTYKVQLWAEDKCDGKMPPLMMGLISQKEAKEMVAEGKCFVINSQAIEFFEGA